MLTHRSLRLCRVMDTLLNRKASAWHTWVILDPALPLAPCIQIEELASVFPASSLIPALMPTPVLSHGHCNSLNISLIPSILGTQQIEVGAWSVGSQMPFSIPSYSMIPFCFLNPLNSLQTPDLHSFFRLEILFLKFSLGWPFCVNHFSEETSAPQKGCSQIPSVKY